MTTPKKKTTWVMTFFPGGARPLLPKVRFQHVQHPERYTACRRVTVQMEPVEAHMELKWSPIEFIWLASGRFGSREQRENSERRGASREAGRPNGARGSSHGAQKEPVGAHMELKRSSDGAQMELKWSSNGAQMESKWSRVELTWSPVELKWSPVELKWSSNRAQWSSNGAGG